MLRQLIGLIGRSSFAATAGGNFRCTLPDTQGRSADRPQDHGGSGWKPRNRNDHSYVPHKQKDEAEALVYGCPITLLAVGIVMLVAAFLLLQASARAERQRRPGGAG
jgi:hypothetical protein